MARENEIDKRPLQSWGGGVAITPSDTTVLSPPCTSLWIGQAAAADQVTLRMLDGSSQVFKFAAGNVLLPVQFDQVKATGTTLTNSNAVGLYNP